MPRLSPRLLAKAWRENPLLPRLLRPCQDLNSARLELRWLKDHARQVAKTRRLPSSRPILHDFCRKRSRGQPLQYILGTEYFGELELRCEPGVLIPRQETAAYVLHLLNLLKNNISALPPKLKVLDLCTGSGCIPLLFAHGLASTEHNVSLELLGVDLSRNAIQLAETNKREQNDLVHDSVFKAVGFVQADILRDDSSSPQPLLKYLRDQGQMQWDILFSNPPYISPKQFNHVTARSVRNFEPKLALVPEAPGRQLSDEDQGDLFYPRLVKLARELDTKVLLMEVGDLVQAKRVASHALADGRWHGIEIWRDEPGGADEDDNNFPGGCIRGRGHARSILCWTVDAHAWLKG